MRSCAWWLELMRTLGGGLPACRRVMRVLLRGWVYDTWVDPALACPLSAMQTRLPPAPPRTHVRVCDGQVGGQVVQGLRGGRARGTLHLHGGQGGARSKECGVG